jgi:hypothetical protein
VSVGQAVPLAPGVRRFRRLAWAGLLLFVSGLHGLLGRWWFDQRLGEGMGDVAPKAIDVAFVKELTLRVPPVAAAPRPPAPARPSAARPPAPKAAASAPVEAASQPASAPALVVAVTEPAVAASASADTAAASSAVAAASAPDAEAFDWPPSTQLLYSMNGHYRGPIVGTAEVDWLRDGDHYQVRLEVRVPPLFTRRMLSDGQLGSDGLVPRRYDQETQVALQATRRDTVRFDGEQIQLANGDLASRPAGVQDVASQFVQMTWIFLTHPERLQVGQVVAFPLALPRRIGRWTYEVTEHGPLVLPFGTVDAYHLQPQRDQLRPNELSVETWIVPALQYLPARILIRQDAESYLDLQLQSRPRQAAPSGGPVPAFRAPAS